MRQRIDLPELPPIAGICSCVHYHDLTPDLQRVISRFIDKQHSGAIEHGPLQLTPTLESLLEWVREGQKEHRDALAYGLFGEDVILQLIEERDRARQQQQQLGSG